MASRRSFIKAAAAIAAGNQLLPLRGLSQSVLNAGRRAGAKRALRLAHVTDTHLEPELGAPEGFAVCLREIQSLTDSPEFLVNGGDAIYDAFAATEARTKEQWQIWREVIGSECKLPMEHCIGNHDIWGGNKEKSGTNGTEPLWGKRWVMDVLGMKQRYRSFDRAGWHFIVLDSTLVKGGGMYEARLDEEQFGWLQQDLAAAPLGMPVVVISHIPILSASGFFHVPDSNKTGDWIMLGVLMHLDAPKIIDLFRQHGQVKLCLSGHIHLFDRIDYDGITYLCNGAVCGNWWKGTFRHTRPGYGLIDLYDDGSFDFSYNTYNWKPEGKG